MTFTRESAESNVEPTRSITSTQENVTVPRDTTSSTESAVSAELRKPTMSSLKLATSPLALESTSTTQKPLKLASASPST